jgi:adenylate cyclase
MHAQDSVMPSDTSSDPPGERKLVAVLYADMVGYSRLIGVDDAGTLARLKRLRTDLIDPAIAEHRGRVVQTGGDSLLVVFDSIDGALRCAVKVQQQVPIHDQGPSPDHAILFRMGIDIGDAIADGTDLHGDGVIVAARLQAECPANGVCVSRAVRDHVHDRLDLAFEPLGPLNLKNVARPVEAFLVRPSAAPKPGEQTLAHSTPEALPLPDKPSLVVLPFQNMSRDPEQDYFADGMVEEITTALSRIRSLFVISRNSAFTYKGRAVDVRQVGRELGVRYVLEGSVRRAGSRVRITGQLVEAASGTHLWADRFDGMLEDVFELQDRVAANVAAAIEPSLRAAEIMRAQRKPTDSLRAYDLVLRAQPLLVTRSRENLTEAERLLRTAIKLDAGYALAVGRLAACHWIMVTQNWVDRADASVDDMVHLVRTALAQDANDPEVLRLAGWILALPGGDLSSGIRLINRAIELNPNSATALQTVALLNAFAGDTELASAQLERSARLDPVNLPIDFYLTHAICHFVSGQFEAVVEWTAKLLERFPNVAPALRYRAASFGLVGRLEEGRKVVQQLLALVPNFTVLRARRHYEFDLNNAFKTPGVTDALYEGLRRCGVPE